jgi:enamine deaminase RidA (YjgF/YER057c/UK114 family)
MLKPINPWTWQDPLGFAQAVEATGTTRTVYLSGQASLGGSGEVLHAGDLPAQVTRSLDNLETVLGAAGLRLQDVVRLNVYTTEPDRLLENWGLVASRLAAGNCRPACTYIGVARLAFPELMVEFEATATA